MIQFQENTQAEGGKDRPYFIGPFRQGPIKSTLITKGVSIAAFANGVGLTIGITLSGTTLAAIIF